MRGFSILLAILGVLIVGGGIIAYFGEQVGFGIAGIVVGSCLLGLGVMMFLSWLLLKATNRAASLLMRIEFFKLKIMVQGELGTLEGGLAESEEAGEELELPSYATRGEL